MKTNLVSFPEAAEMLLISKWFLFRLALGTRFPSVKIS